MKDHKIRELIRRQQVPPDIEELRNENEYLQLSILNLENEIHQLQETINKQQLEKEVKRHHRRSYMEGEEEQD
jgi:hypothetical protein